MTEQYEKMSRELVNEMWPDLERTMLPLIQYKAAKVPFWILGMDMADCIQEGRMALMVALAKYDHNKGANIKTYAAKVLDNLYAGLVNQVYTQRRMPRATQVTKDGPKQVCIPPVSIQSITEYIFDECYAAVQPLPDDCASWSESDDQLTALLDHVFSGLKKRDREVYRCRVDPPYELMTVALTRGGDFNNPSNADIAQFLGVSKNAVDWSICRTKAAFSKIISDDKFSGMFKGLIEDKEWPVIHTSDRRCDDQFIEETMWNRGLSLLPVGKGILKCSQDGSLVLEKYLWGAAICVDYKDQARTCVVEGRFNLINGEVFGPTGIRLALPIPWFKKAVKNMRDCG
jgi:RNA polymerase sigma factor (sigma-70 family)